MNDIFTAANSEALLCSVLMWEAGERGMAGKEMRQWGEVWCGGCVGGGVEADVGRSRAGSSCRYLHRPLQQPEEVIFRSAKVG